MSKKIEYIVLPEQGEQGVMLVNTEAQCKVARRRMAALKIVKARVFRASDREIVELRRYVYADGRAMTGACHKATKPARRPAPRRHQPGCRCVVCVRKPPVCAVRPRR